MYNVIPSNIPIKVQNYLKFIHIKVQAVYSTAVISILEASTG